MSLGKLIDNPGKLRCSGSMCESFNCLWKIENFSSLRHQVGEEYRTDSIPTVDAGKVRWFLRLYPGGMDYEDEENVQCAMFCDNNLGIYMWAEIYCTFADIDNEFIATELINWTELEPGMNLEVCSAPREIVLDRLVDDILVINVEICYTRSIVKSGETTRFLTQQSPYSELVEDYVNLPHQMEDAVIVVRGVEIPVHSVVVLAHSKVLADLIEGERKENNRIVIDESDIDTVMLMIQFMYDGRVGVPLNVPLASKLVRFGKKYELDSLVSYCMCYLTAARDIEESLDSLGA